MNRRKFLNTAAAVGISLALPAPAFGRVDPRTPEISRRMVTFLSFRNAATPPVRITELWVKIPALLSDGRWLELEMSIPHAKGIYPNAWPNE